MFFWRNFTEEALEEGSEACIEAGFAVAGGIDAWLAQQAMQRNSLLGSDRTVEITPDRSAPDERIILERPRGCTATCNRSGDGNSPNARQSRRGSAN
jgi:hypothetical protein